MTAAAPSEGGDTSYLFTGETIFSLFITSSTVIFAPNWAHGWSRAFSLFLTATSAISSSLTLYACMYLLISSAKIQRRVTPRGLSVVWSKMDQNAVSGVRVQRGHLLLGDGKAGVEEAGCHVPPRPDGCEYARPTAHVDPCVRPSYPAGAFEQVLALHVHSVERVGSAPDDHRIDVLHGHAGRAERHVRRLVGELPSSLKQPPPEEGHPGPDHSHPSLDHHITSKGPRPHPSPSGLPSTTGPGPAWPPSPGPARRRP